MAISSSAVDGLISGLDTASIISQLIAVDAAPQTALKNNVTKEQARSDALTSVNAKMKTLSDAVGAFKDASAWTALKATSSSDAVAASTTSSAAAGDYFVRVDNLASAKAIAGKPTFTANDATAATQLGFPMDIKVGSQIVTINKTTGTLSELTDAINEAAGFGVKAVAIKVSDGSYRLQITAKQTGTAGSFEMLPNQVGSVPKQNNTDSETDFYSSLASAQPAKLTVLTSPDADTGIQVTSATNTFSDVFPGVTFTAAASTPNAPVKISVARDTEGMATSMQALVDAANAALKEIANQTKAGTVSSSGSVSDAGTLRGNSLLRTLQSDIIQAVTGALSDGSSAATFGLQSTRDGQIEFKKEVFVAALVADPAKAQALLAPKTLVPATQDEGVIDRLLKVATKSSDPYDGSISKAIKGQGEAIDALQDKIADWDTRLAAKKARYQAYYARLEVALGKLQNQSNWLSGQLANLSGSNS